MCFKAFRILSVTLLLGVPGAFCNPRITIGDPPNGTPVQLDFTFSADSSGGGYFTFTNNSSQNWTTVDFFFTEPSGTNITCSSSIFDFCEVTNSAINDIQSSYDVGFEGVTHSPGIPAGSSFTIDLNSEGTAANGVGDWCPDTHFTAEANLTPEPASLGAVGLICICGSLVWRRKRKSTLWRP